MPGVQADRMGRDSRFGYGPPGGARSGRRRQRALHRLGLRDGPGSHRDQSLRHSGHSHPLRLGCEIPRASRRPTLVAGRRMNVSYEWLRALVAFHETPAKLRDLITSRVATVDELVPLAAELNDIIVARVVEAGAHPDSDHLWVTKVDAGTGTLL